MGNPPNIPPRDLLLKESEDLMGQRLMVIRELSDIFDVTIDAYDFHKLAHWVYTGIDKDHDVFLEAER